MDKYLTKDRRDFIIREPTEDDASDIITYSKVLFASTDQVLTTLEEYTVTVEEEKVWINNLNEIPNAKILIAELNNRITGLLFFMPNLKLKNAHTGEFGVNVHPAFQRLGIGRRLIESLLNWAKSNKQIEKVYLNVFATNRNAIKLYKGLGFIEEGRHVKAIRQPTGEYVDILQLYIETK